MNKLEHISLNSALKPSKPFIDECFFPIIHDRYITFDFDLSDKSTAYQHWAEVIKFMLPFLDNEGIKIIRLGQHHDVLFDGVINKFELTKNQISYIIKRSLLHFNSLNYFTYLSTLHDTPLVSLCTKEINSSFCFPLRDNNCFYSSKSFKKDDINSIQNIPPCLVASSILDFLNISNKLKDLKFLFHGDNSHIKTIEVVPDWNAEPSFLKGSLLNIRADLSFNENQIFSFIPSRQVGIVCNSRLSEQFIYSSRSSVRRISYNVDDGVDKDFLQDLNKYHINYEMFTTKSNSLEKLRLENFNETIEYFPYNEKKDLDFVLDKCDNVFMTSSKTLYSNAKPFSSKAHWITGQSSKDHLNTVIDTSDFWHDLDFFNLYSKNES